MYFLLGNPGFTTGWCPLLGANPWFTSSGGSRIFPRGVRQLPEVLLFFNFFLKTAWKWKNLDPQGGEHPSRPPLDPPMTSAILRLQVSLWKKMYCFPRIFNWCWLVNFTGNHWVDQQENLNKSIKILAKHYQNLYEVWKVKDLCFRRHAEIE